MSNPSMELTGRLLCNPYHSEFSGIWELQSFGGATLYAGLIDDEYMWGHYSTEDDDISWEVITLDFAKTLCAMGKHVYKRPRG